MADRDPDCIFCKILDGELPSQKVDEDDRTYTFMDINPGTRGHALVIPKRHTRDLEAIEPEDLAACAAAAQRIAGRMFDRLGADGVNVINACRSPAWQTVFHFHFHVVPRYTDDTLRLPWIPAPGDPDEIAATAEKLR